MSANKTAGGPPEPVRFEEALARLEAIVQELEGTELSLEETLARYEEGSRLVRECARRLDEAEQRIRTLAATGAEELPGEDGSEEGGDAQGDPEEGLPF